MTSSLVGSEMCIRDRRFDPNRAPDNPATTHLKGGAYRCRECGKIGLVSVSYTHLTLPTICSV
eukprot:7254652-Prorocentrum_lima.AAC.1